MADKYFSKINGILVKDSKAQADMEQLKSDLGEMAYVDTATANYTPAGTIDTPTFSGTAASISVSGTPSGSVSITPTTTTINSVTNAGTLPSLTYDAQTREFTFSAGALTTTESKTVMTDAAASFSGSSLTSTGSYTPAGTVSQPSFTGTSANITVSPDINE